MYAPIKHSDTVLTPYRCYLPCDGSSCNVDLPRHPTAFLWRAKVEGVDLCYSYENCGGVDFFTDGPAAECVKRGGYFVDGHCTCDDEHNDCPKDMPVNAAAKALATVGLPMGAGSPP